jgi:hypothetical protein
MLGRIFDGGSRKSREAISTSSGRRKAQWGSGYSSACKADIHRFESGLRF